MSQVRFRIPGRPPTINELQGAWGRAFRLKRAWTQLVMIQARNYRIPRAVCRRKVDLVVALGKGRRQTDPDALWKAALDALTRTKLLVNDNPLWCEMGTVTYAERVNGQGWTEYVLTDVEAA